jgi:glycine dehydrogenase subunit 1
LLDKGILAGLPLGDFRSDMKNLLLVAVTEVRTRQQIDDFVHQIGQALN